MRSEGAQGSTHEIQEDQESVWSFFDSYKTPGVDNAVARPEMSSFHHISDDTKQKDQALVHEKMARPHMREQKVRGPDAFAFENFLVTQAMKHDWFGGEVTSTTNYDDWISGVDAVVEWPAKDGKPPVRMAIDFTAAEQVETFFKKSDKLEGNILLKYLRSAVEFEDGKPKEMRVSMPVVLLGFDRQVFRKLAQEQQLDHEHPLRRLLLEQASAQIDLQLKLALEKAGRKPLAIKTHQRIENLTHVKQTLDEELEVARKSIVNEEWQKLVQTSKTHQLLSGREST